MTKIFFSWQSDTPAKGGRSFIREALDAAVMHLTSDVEIEAAVRAELATDSDTQGLPGSPAIVEAILEKIDSAAVFVADLTFTGTRPKGQPTPNPNVLIEYGWASKALGRSKVLCVMNTAYGMPTQESMPFDLVHIRHPLQYACAADCDAQARKTALKALTTGLFRAIKVILQETEHVPTSAPFHPREPESGRCYFRGVEAIGAMHSRLPQAGGPPKRVYLHPRHAMWLRLMPVHSLNEPCSMVAIEKALAPQQGMPSPLNWEPNQSLRMVRGPDGFGWIIDPGPDEDSTPAVFYAFESGELWSVDTAYASSNGVVYFDETKYAECLKSCLHVLDRLGIPGPYRWIAGLEGIGRRQFVSPRVQRGLSPSIFEKNIVEREGTVSGVEADAAATLAPFFRAVFDAAHLVWSPARGTAVE